MSTVETEAILGRWVHAHEEDSDDETVLRPADHPLPPARGRLSLDLKADGTYVESAPGPVDVPVESRGRWTLERNRLRLIADDERPDRTWKILAANDRRLAVHEE